MGKTAILVDGGFFRRRIQKEWNLYTPEDSAKALINYCKKHLVDENGEKHSLYRIFYYDCPPLNSLAYHPLLQKEVNLGESENFYKMSKFLDSLKSESRVALRLGKLDSSSVNFTLDYDLIKKLCNGTAERKDLKLSDFSLTTKQKGVDMKLGIDMTSMSLKKQIDRIVLVAGDSDFVPAIKLARREGIIIELDTLGMNISKNGELYEHVDNRRGFGSPFSNMDLPTLIPHKYSLCIIRKPTNKDQLLVFYHNDWKTWLFPTYKQTNQNDQTLVRNLKDTLQLENSEIKISFLDNFNSEKYSKSHHEERSYEYKIYDVTVEDFKESILKAQKNFKICGKKYKWMTLEEMFNDESIVNSNQDILSKIKQISQGQNPRL